MNENWNSKTGNIGNLGGKWEIGKTIDIGKTGTFWGKGKLRYVLKIEIIHEKLEKLGNR